MKILTWVCFLAALQGSGRAQGVIVRPKSGDVIPAYSKGVIVAGHVDAGSMDDIFINGQKVPVYRTGSFMTYLPIPRDTGGEFVITAAAAPKTAALDSVTISVEKPKDALAAEQIASTLEPKAALTEILPGEALTISFQAPEGGQAHFKIASVTGKEPLVEVRPGTYEGRFLLPASETFQKSKEGELLIFFEARKIKTVKLSTQRVVRTAKTGKWPKALRISVANAKILANAVSGSYWFSLPSGTVLTGNGIFGNLYRVRLAGALSGWVSTNDASIERYLPKAPTIDAIEVIESTATAETIVRIGWQGNLKLPYMIEETAQREMRLRLFNARIHLNWIPYKSADQVSLIDSVRWNIPQEDEVDISIDLHEFLRWGYWVDSYPGGLTLRFRRTRSKFEAPLIGPPAKRIPNQRASPYRQWLSGMKIIVDPGHGGKETGATAPSGKFEQEMNLRLAQSVAGALEALGAQVVLTRSTTDQTIGLDERVFLARQVNADLFISVHCNDFSSWTDPFSRNGLGSTVYYNHLPALPLAQHVEAALAKQKALKIPSNGILWGDLYVIRELTIPAILIESGYVVYPWQEELLAWGQDFADFYGDAVAQALEFYSRPSPPTQGSWRR
ncbi:MAG: N-acetylmuramoyl-L-alanine amidase [Elusimicrobia bacterium]|nr:N-acetylmuramoyl-L-alanine amidase [Elusimicrobiota bacterium]